MQPNIAKSAMINGLFIGLLLSVKFVFSAQNNNLLASLSLAVSVFVLFVLYRMTFNLREKELEGIITYRQAFHYMFKTYLYGSLIASLVILIYTKFIDKSYLDTIMNAQLKLYETFKFNIDDQSLNMFEKMYKPASFALLNILGSIISGTFWSLILSAFVKKDKSIFEN